MRNSTVSALVLSLGALFLSPSAYAGWDGDVGKANQCYDTANGLAEFRSLSGKLAVGAPTLAELSDERLPDQADANAVRSLALKLKPCRELHMAAVRRYHPFAVSMHEVLFFKTDLVYVQLIQRRMTFGNANRLIHEAYVEYAERWERYAQVRSDEERRAIADSLNQISQQARTPPPPYPSSGRLTCRWVGPTLYCDPY